MKRLTTRKVDSIASKINKLSLEIGEIAIKYNKPRSLSTEQYMVELLNEASNMLSCACVHLRKYKQLEAMPKY